MALEQNRRHEPAPSPIQNEIIKLSRQYYSVVNTSKYVVYSKIKQTSQRQRYQPVRAKELNQETSGLIIFETQSSKNYIDGF